MQWVVWLMPAGISLDPRSDNFESVTLALHKDGVLHTMPGAYGTFEITAQAGNFATVKWTFTGTYQAPVDDPNPSPTFERTLPSEVELARLTVNQFSAVVEKFTFNQGNDIVDPGRRLGAERLHRSAHYEPQAGRRDRPRSRYRREPGLLDRDGDGSAHAVPDACRLPPRQYRLVLAPNTQYTGMTYTDRNGILAYDAGLSFSRINGNDENCIYLM